MLELAERILENNQELVGLGAASSVGIYATAFLAGEVKADLIYRSDQGEAMARKQELESYFESSSLPERGLKEALHVYKAGELNELNQYLETSKYELLAEWED